MAIVTKSIRTIAGDYTTVILWKGDHDNGAVYSSGDEANGQMFPDSTFDENPIIDGGNTIGLIKITLTVTVGNRHDGTPLTGVIINSTSTTESIIQYLGATNSIDGIIEWIEITENSTSPKPIGLRYTGTSGDTFLIRNMLIRDLTGTLPTREGTGINITGNGATVTTMNSFIYRCVSSDDSEGEGVLINDTAGQPVLNSTIVNCPTAGTRRALDAKNVICMDCGTDFLNNKGTHSNNMSADASAIGAGSLTSQVTADQFISIVVGSENLHKKDGSAGIESGVNLGTTPAGIEIDIDGKTRGPIWSMGADGSPLIMGVAENGQEQSLMTKEGWLSFGAIR